MEDVLELYAADHPPEEPLVCMDEASKQLLRGGADPVPMAPGRPAREDYCYERRGTQALFCFFDPIRGWRRVAACDSRTAVDWAEQVRILLEEDYPHARKVKLVCDNLNTHTAAALYEAFPAEQARALARRLEIHYTPVHGSWLNVAEIELSVLARQCLDRRIGSAEELRAAVAAWVRERNADRSRVVWRFTAADARIKLRHLYPQIKA
jgi:DDE superfamily endonuclease